ncbi:MAG TPA: hypothetical protein P5229_01080 [Candidatus Gracilibacteria bacterium]|nr:hypothetical protein [Candidatus Gracilibacteria bacterium]
MNYNPDSDQMFDEEAFAASLKAFQRKVSAYRNEDAGQADEDETGSYSDIDDSNNRTTAQTSHSCSAVLAMKF